MIIKTDMTVKTLYHAIPSILQGKTSVKPDELCKVALAVDVSFILKFWKILMRIKNDELVELQLNMSRLLTSGCLLKASYGK